MAPRPSSIAFALCFATAVLPLSNALRVAQGSPCVSFCTAPSDPIPENSVSDPDDEGSMDCLSCLQRSTFTNGVESDQDWFFYNAQKVVHNCVLRGVFSTSPDRSSCVAETCDPLINQLREASTAPAHATSSMFCDTLEGFADCVTCVLRDEPNKSQLPEFLDVLDNGCRQKRDAVTTVAQAAISSSSSSSSSVMASRSSSGLSKGAIAGIVVGAVALTALVIGAISTYICLRRRSRHSYQHYHNDLAVSEKGRTGPQPMAENRPHTRDYDDERFFTTTTTPTPALVKTAEPKSPQAVMVPVTTADEPDSQPRPKSPHRPFSRRISASSYAPASPKGNTNTFFGIPLPEAIPEDSSALHDDTIRRTEFILHDPGCEEEHMSPKTPKTPKSPRSLKSPRTPKTPKSPRSPSWVMQYKRRTIQTPMGSPAYSSEIQLSFPPPPNQ